MDKSVGRVLANFGCLGLFLLWSWAGYILWVAFGWWGFVPPWSVSEMPLFQVMWSISGLVFTVAVVWCLRPTRENREETT